MLNLVVNNDKEEEYELPPKLKRKGRGPTEEDWLSPMKAGTEFLVRSLDTPRWLMREFTHLGKKEGHVLLTHTATINTPSTWVWVDPVEFCKAFELRAILEVPEDEVE